MPGSRRADPPGAPPAVASDRRRRTVAAGATALIHAALLLCFLFWPGERTPSTVERPALALFDLPLPPAPPPDPVRPPDSVQPRPTTVSPHDTGGSRPAHDRPATAAQAQASTPTELPRLPYPTAPTASTLLAEGTALDPGRIDLGLGSGARPGGTGGSGSGTGDGVGSGDGRGARARGATWIYKPTEADLRPYWPAAAGEQKLSGRVVLSCIVPRPGRPKRCEVLSEEPATAGFGAAAVRSSRLFRIDPIRWNGRTMNWPVHIPIDFVFHEGGAKP